MATTHSAQEVISTAEQLFEGFIADYYMYINLTECIEWCDKVMKPFRKKDEFIDDFITKKSVSDVTERLLGKIINRQNNDEEILYNYLNTYTTEELGVLYYKNNIKEFIYDHEEVSDCIIKIFTKIENLDYVDPNDDKWYFKIPEKYRNKMIDAKPSDWNKFVNVQYFMNPNDVPESIADDLFELKDYLMKYVYCRYLSFDRIYRIKNFKRGVVTVIDTDSNILSLDPLVYFIKDNIIKNQSFGRSEENNDFICVNMIAYVLTNAVTDTLLTFGKQANIPEEFRPIYNMKNEFFFSKLVIGNSKKRYISRIDLREGNLYKPAKTDVKGFDLKKSSTSDRAEKVFMDIINNRIIYPADIDVKGTLRDLFKFKDEIITSIRSGEIDFLPNLNAKEIGAYSDPKSQASIIGALTWNMFSPEDQIYLPAKVRALKLNIFKIEDVADLKETHPDYYEIICDNIFNDKTGYFITKSKTKDGYKEKCRGMNIIDIPTNEKIPEWLQPYIDINTMVNNILAPFYPVLEILNVKTVEEGKQAGGTNRKTNTISNIIKF